MKPNTMTSALTLFVVLWMPLHAQSEGKSHIRTLASSCAICHGSQQSNGDVIPSLVGLDEDYFINKMKSYRTSEQGQEVMVQHAKGLTEVEIEQLATLFATQPRSCRYFKHNPNTLTLDQ